MLILILLASLFAQTQVHVYQSQHNPQTYFADKGLIPLDGKGDGIDLDIHPNNERQEVIGFGGAFTETSAYNWDSLNAAKRAEVLDLLFSKDGLDFSVCRTHINSPDFALGEYTYVKDNDETLSTFDLGQDRKYVLPFIQAAKKITGDDLFLFASPWSAPGWMKTNNKMINGGRLQDKYYQTWADYFVKYIQAYKEEGIDFWGVTIQNEPLASQSWESMEWSGQDEGRFAVNNLRPALDKAELNHIKIQAWDHNKGVLVDRSADTYGVSGALDAVWGMANHWYDFPVEFNALTTVHNKWPDHHLTISEFCRGDGDYGGQGHSHDDIPRSNWWDMAAYGSEIIGDLNGWVEAITDWNMIVDQDSGPYHNRNGGVKAPVVVNRTTGNYEIGYIYHALGHFSKFIKRGAHIIQTSSTNGDVRITAAKNKDGSLVAVVLNLSGNEQQVSLNLEGSQNAAVVLPAESLTTFQFQ